MASIGSAGLWLMDCALQGLDAPEALQAFRAQLAAAQSRVTGVWRAMDDSMLRAYCSGGAQPGPDWSALAPLQSLAGASAGRDAPFHYVVETDALSGDVAQLNAWYEQEHLPGLAAVPGTVHAARYRRLAGAPEFYACYDLLALDTLHSPAWLAVRHTDWSSRVRPLFRHPVRTQFRRALELA